MHFNSMPALSSAIGLKDMFQGFGSRKQVARESTVIMDGRRRQSFVLKHDPGSPRSGSPSEAGSPRDPDGGDDCEDLSISMEFSTSRSPRGRSNSISSVAHVGSNGMPSSRGGVQICKVNSSALKVSSKKGQRDDSEEEE